MIYHELLVGEVIQMGKVLSVTLLQKDILEIVAWLVLVVLGGVDLVGRTWFQVIPVIVRGRTIVKILGPTDPGRVQLLYNEHALVILPLPHKLMRLLHLRLLQRPQLEVMRVVRDHPSLILQRRHRRHSHPLILTTAYVHRLKLNAHANRLVYAYVIAGSELPQVVLVDALLRCVGLEVEILQLQLADTQGLVVEDAHVGAEGVVDVLRAVLLLNDLVEDFF